ncbi:MAG: hypothetical protein R3B70_26060 [Polyangiaceae bacterium]
MEEAPDGWMGPNLYWLGPPKEFPGCPAHAPSEGTQLWADLASMPASCPSCTCGPSETTCLPPTEWTVAAAKCSDAEGAITSSFDVLANNWAGVCNTDHAIGQGAQCGGVPCVQSVTVAAPKAVGTPCKPIPVGTFNTAPWTWGKSAQECLVTPTESCLGGNGTGEEDAEGFVCVPVPGDLLACVSFFHSDPEDKVECPAFYNERHEMFRNAEDHRTCTPCSCGAPEGGECAMTVGVFADSMCSDLVNKSVVLSGDEPACHDIPSGVALGGKEAEVKATFSGTCAPSGGKPFGTVEPIRRVTLCCHHEVVP